MNNEGPHEGWVLGKNQGQSRSSVSGSHLTHSSRCRFKLSVRYLLWLLTASHLLQLLTIIKNFVAGRGRLRLRYVAITLQSATATGKPRQLFPAREGYISGDISSARYTAGPWNGEKKNVWIHGCVESRRREAGSVRRDWLERLPLFNQFPILSSERSLIPGVHQGVLAQSKAACHDGTRRTTPAPASALASASASASASSIHPHVRSSFTGPSSSQKFVDARLSEGPFPSPSNASGRYQLPF